MKKFILFSASFLTLTSCISTQVASLKSTGIADIQIYMIGTQTPAFNQCVYIEASGGIFQSKKQLLQKLKKRAAKEINVDALVNARFGYQGLWPYVDGVAVNIKK